MSGLPVDGNLLSLWLGRAQKDAVKCFICQRIAEGNAGRAGGLISIKISGIDLTPEMQIAHLSRCVGDVQRSS